MADCVHQVKAILRVYLQRGEAALASYGAGRIDDGNAWLKRRTAAFHNLRAAEALLPSSSLASLTADPEVLELWQAIRALDARLALEIQAAQQKTAALLQTLQAARQKINGYRSGTPELSMFERSA